AEDGIRDFHVTGVQTCALPIWVRYEHMAYNYDNRMIAGRTREDGTPCGFGGCRYSRPADRKDRFDNLSPKLGLLYQLAADHQLRSEERRVGQERRTRRSQDE